VLGACVAGSLPQARIVVRASTSELLSHRDIVFDGSASQDTNPGGAVRAYSWAVRRGAGATCDPTAVRGEAAAFTTNFQCPGQFVIELQVQNDRGLASVPEEATLEIGPSANPPVITSMGADLAFEHRCTGSPVLCAAIGAGGEAASFQLDATATDVEDGDKLSYTWSAVPPDGADAAATHVSFAPDAHTRTPIASLKTDGARVAGEWRFEVRVEDGDHLVTVGTQRVTVSNRAPAFALAPGPIVATHQFNVAAGRYYASGSIDGTVTDPDGDPLLPPLLSVTEGATAGCDFTLNDSTLHGSTVHAAFSLSCPADNPAGIIGAAERSVTVTLRDVNGGEASASTRLEVGNTPPVFALAAGASRAYTVPHTVQPCLASVGQSCFTVDTEIPFVVGDPELDPVSLSLTPAGLASAATFQAASPTHFKLQVPTSQPADFRRADGTMPGTFGMTAGDPWTSSSDAFTIRVANAAPAVALLSGTFSVPHRYSEAEGAYVSTFDLATASDADGDPLIAVATSTDGMCAATGIVGGKVRVRCAYPAGPITGPARATPFQSFGREIRASVQDPWTSSGSTPPAGLEIQNGPPAMATTAPGFIGTTPCHCSGCNLIPNGPGIATVDPAAVDPDGDPLEMTVTFASGAPAQTVRCAPGACTFDVAVTTPTSVTVTITDGQFTAQKGFSLSRQCEDETIICGTPTRCNL
jgi:hypothetical protein